jgi:undecaprenyl diphosphate synthase
MDGNGRWAKARNLPRSAGHKEGLKAAKRVVREASRLGIDLLTLYVFSTENWRRTEEEVSFLMRLIKQHLRKEYNFYRENKIRVCHSGDISALPGFVQKEINRVRENTKDFTGLTVNLAINYGGRDEICRAVQRWLTLEANSGSGAVKIEEADISRCLDLGEFPQIDLIIRTGGEKRLSNFLLWQSAYAELYFSDRLWPDWGAGDLQDALKEYQNRERKFGGAS